MIKNISGLGFALLLGTTSVMAEKFEVTITNITGGEVAPPGLIFTPILVVSHSPGVSLFTLGDAASVELAALAEGGDTGPLSTLLAADPLVADMGTSGAPLLPGDSVTVTVDAPKGRGRVSVVSMLLPTNDAFFALNGVETPKRNRTVSYTSPGYDAGSEPNDELCINIPGGGGCSGDGGSPNFGGEGSIYIHNGIQGVGDLTASSYDWKNPVAYISIKRVK